MTKWHFWDKKAAFLEETETKRKLSLTLRRKNSVDELEPGLRNQENHLLLFSDVKKVRH